MTAGGGRRGQQEGGAGGGGGVGRIRVGVDSHTCRMKVWRLERAGG